MYHQSQALMIYFYNTCTCCCIDNFCAPLMVEWNHQQLVQVIWIEVASSLGSYISSWPNTFPTVPVYNKSNRVYMYCANYVWLIILFIINLMSVPTLTALKKPIRGNSISKHIVSWLVIWKQRGLKWCIPLSAGDWVSWTSPVSSHSVSSITYPRSLKKHCYQDSKEPSKTSILCSYHIFNSKNTPVRLSEKNQPAFYCDLQVVLHIYFFPWFCLAKSHYLADGN